MNDPDKLLLRMIPTSVLSEMHCIIDAELQRRANVARYNQGTLRGTDLAYVIYDEYEDVDDDGADWEDEMERLRNRPLSYDRRDRD